MKQSATSLGKLAAVLLPVCLLAFGVFAGIHHLLGSPEPVKTALHKSGLYEAVTSEAQHAARQNPDQDWAAGIPLDDPKVQAAIAKAIPPEFVRQQAEGAIDNIYAWLHGKTQTTDFGFDFLQVQARLAYNLADYSQQHLASLPACRGGEIPNLEQPLSSKCLPSGFDIEQASAQVRNDILHNDELQKNTNFTISNLKDSSGQAIEQKFSKVPAVYEQVKWSMYISGLLAVLLAVAVVFTNDRLYTGFKRLGFTALIVGAICVATAWTLTQALHSASYKLAESGSDAYIQASTTKLIEHLSQDMRNWGLWYGLGLMAAGVAALVAWRVIKKRQQVAIAAPQEVQAIIGNGTPPIAPSAPQTPASRPKPPRLIQ